MAAEPTPPFRVRAIADYNAASGSELSLVTGQEYDVTATDGRGVWWQSYVNGVVGWFPASYTQIIPQAAAHAPTPAPQPAAASTNMSSTFGGNTAQANHVRQTSASVSVGSTSATAPARTTTPIGGAAKKQEAKEPRPGAPVKQHIDKNKNKNLPTYLKLQIVEARGLRAVGDVKKTNPAACVYMRDLLNDKDEVGRDVDRTGQADKTVDPKWNELFQIIVTDAERETVVIRFVNAKKYDKKDTKNFLGEVSFPLRGAVRDYDAPNYQYKWYNVTGKDATGKVHIYIEYFDSRVTSAPTNFQRVGHIGLDANGQFDVSNIPPELKRLFQSVGIKKSDLKDASFAKTVFNAIDQYEKSGGDLNAASSALASAAPAAPKQQQQQYAQQEQAVDPTQPFYQTGPDGQQWVWDPSTQQWYEAAQFQEYQRQMEEYARQVKEAEAAALAQSQYELQMQEQQMQAEMAALNSYSTPGYGGGIPAPIRNDSYDTPAPIPPPIGGGGAPAPPPPPPPPPAPSASAPKAPPPRPAEKKGPAPVAAAEGRDDLLASIRGFGGGAGGLRPASNSAPPPPQPESSGGGDLTSILKNAMLAHRKAHSDANDQAEEDWGEDDDW